MILSLDQATSKTGFSLWESGELVNSGVIKAPAKLSYDDRLSFMRNSIINFLKEYKIDLIYIEGIQLEQIDNTSKDISVDTFRKLAHLQGILIQLFNETDTQYEIIYPSVWKSTLNIFTHKRKEQKEMAKNYVMINFKKLVSEDEADAICIGASKIIKEKFAW